MFRLLEVLFNFVFVSDFHVWVFFASFLKLQLVFRLEMIRTIAAPSHVSATVVQSVMETIADGKSLASVEKSKVSWLLLNETNW